MLVSQDADCMTWVGGGHGEWLISDRNNILCKLARRQPMLALLQSVAECGRRRHPHQRVCRNHCLPVNPVNLLHVRVWFFVRRVPPEATDDKQMERFPVLVPGLNRCR